MQQYFVCCLLILLGFECIYCCSDGEVLINSRCEQCLPPKVVSLDQRGCDSGCKRGEFISSTGSFQMCVEACQEIVDHDGIHCFICLIKDMSKNNNVCLNQLKQSTNGLISSEELIYQKECLIDNSIVNITNKKCIICDQKTHKIIEINEILRCIKNCPNPYIFDHQYECIKPSECTGFIHLEKNKYEEKCQGYTFPNQKQPQKYCSYKCPQYKFERSNQWECLNKCPQKTRIIHKEKKICFLNLQDCKQIVSSDNHYCVSECEKGELIQIDDYWKCQTGCKEFKYEEFREQFCSKYCPGRFFIDTNNGRCYEHFNQCPIAVSSDWKFCVQSCQENETIKYPEGNPQICISKCRDFQFEQSGKQYCTSQCPENMVTDKMFGKCHTDFSGCEIAVSVDGKQCVKFCNLDNREGIVSKKCTVCPDYLSVNEQICKETCSEGEIVDKQKMLCYKSKDQCPGFISSDGVQCLRRCDPHKKEVPNYYDYLKQCIVCEDYFVEKEIFHSCQTQCYQGQITIIPLKRCTKKIADCQNYFMSVDGKSCDLKCNLPDILKEGKCVKVSECQGDNDILDETTDPIECKNKGNNRQSCVLESLDGRKCVNSCLLNQIEKRQPPNSFSFKKCENYCKPPQQFFITQQNGLIEKGCKESISASESQEVVMQLLQEVTTIIEFQQIKNYLTDFISSYELNDPQKLSELIQMFEGLARKVFSTLLKDNFSSVKNNVHYVGSNNNAIVCFQLIGKGRSIQKFFNIPSIMRNPSLDLTEINHRYTDSTDSDENGILLFIFKNNPHCKKDICTDFPVVFVDIINLRHKRNLAVQGLDLRAIFSMKWSQGQYQCLHFNEDLSQVKEKTRPQIDQITLSCSLDGPTSVEIVDGWSEIPNVKKSVLIFLIIFVVIT